jgi:hypothetical protein
MWGEYIMDGISKLIEFGGRMLLEGPFLEQVMAAYLLKIGKKVVPRVETGGILHDILVEGYDGFIVYECTGQRDIKEDKIDRFHSQVLELHDTLKMLEGKGVVEAVFAVAASDDAWAPSAKDAVKHIEESFKRRINAKLTVISGLNLISELIRSGVLGLRLVKGKLHFAGPEDYAIRYDPDKDKKEFKLSFAPFSSMELSRFRELPHSFLPSYYWESYYKDLYLESSEGKGEPLSIWSYYYEEGVKWTSTEEMVEAYYNYLNLFPRTYVIEKGDNYLIEEHKSRRGNYSYIVHLFSVDDRVDSSITRSLVGKAVRIMDRVKHEQASYLEEKPFSIYIHSASEDWSLKAWSELKKHIPEPLAKDITTVTVERGNEIIQRLLNLGVLGLRFRNKNEITLVGPGVEAVRRSGTDTGPDIVLSKEPYFIS